MSLLNKMVGSPCSINLPGTLCWVCLRHVDVKSFSNFDWIKFGWVGKNRIVPPLIGPRNEINNCYMPHTNRLFLENSVQILIFEVKYGAEIFFGFKLRHNFERNSPLTTCHRSGLTPTPLVVSIGLYFWAKRASKI